MRWERAWNKVVCCVSFMGFKPFLLVSLYIRWAPVVSRPSVGCNFDWARHLWDTSSTKFSLPFSLCASLSHSVSLCLRMRPSGLCWWSQACWLESVRARPVCVLEHNSLCILPCFGHRVSLIPLSRTFYIWNTPHLHLYRRAAQRPRSGIMNKIIISKYQRWNYPFLCVSASFFSKEVGGGEGVDAGDWEATVRTCQRKLEGVSGPWTQWLENRNQRRDPQTWDQPCVKGKESLSS